MAIFGNLFLAILTRSLDDAGTSSKFNLTVNVADDDILDQTHELEIEDGGAAIFGGPLQPPFDSTGLTKFIHPAGPAGRRCLGCARCSAVRVGFRVQ
jgi:hypothetical protein